MPRPITRTPRRVRRSRHRVAAASIISGLLITVALSSWSGASAEATPVVRDFESDAIGAVPAGCTPPDGHEAATVTDRRAQSGERSLLLADGSTPQQTATTCPAPGDGADLRLGVYPERLGNGFEISVLGSFTGKPETGVPVFQLRVNTDGSMSWFDGLVQDNLGWTQISPAGSITTDAWSTITVQVPRDQVEARVYVNADPGDGPDQESYVGAAGPVGVSPVDTISGFQLAGPAQPGDDELIFVDDVAVDDGTAALPAPRHATFGVGSPTIFDHTDEGFMQMPNTAVSVATASGPDEVLVGYPVHGDATHDTGTALASSLDNGRSWTPADDRNPFPDAQSFYLSRLADGDLLAVSYHTFMIEDSGSLQAEVPTARSSDGGRTWTHRAGRMTAPEAMRPISDGTSRPGHPLGGFVLVHKVVEDPDGTLYQSGYGYYADDERYRQIIMASTDGGENWTVRSTVAVDPELSDHPRYEGFCEGAFARAADGSLISIMRTGNYQSLYQSRSTDDGATWSDPVPVKAGPDQVPVTGVFPDLIMMDNGTLVLYVGRPGQFVLASTDGTGESWGRPKMIDYLNSGNGTVVPIGRNHFLAFGDRGADWTPNVPERKAVWASRITVRPS